jgi:VCBS repeat-containing protein
MTIVADATNNHTFATALHLNGQLFSTFDDPNVYASNTVPHVTVNAVAEGGFDYYSFTLTESEFVVIDIDNGWPDVDTHLTLYSNPNDPGALGFSNNNGVPDPGSNGTPNSFGLLPDSELAVSLQPGTWYLQVAQDPNNTFAHAPLSSPQAYTLHISATSASPNSPPTGINDTAAVDEDATVAGNVLTDGSTDDSDLDGDALSVSAILAGTTGTTTAVNAIGDAVVTGAYGTLTIHANGNYSYAADGAILDTLPAGAVTPAEVFTYSVSDGNGGTDTATLTINVTALNSPPTAINDTAAVNEDATAAGNVLTDGSTADGDPDGNALSVSTILAGTTGTATAVIGDTVVAGAYGTLTIHANGSYSYAADADILDTLPAGAVTPAEVFTYSVSDANGGTDTATLTINVTALTDTASQSGGNGNDTLTGDTLRAETEDTLLGR